MQAGLAVAMDKTGRDHCVVVVKGTFTVDNHGRPMLAEKQEPLVYADVHYGDPAATSIKYECDFARFKPNADVIVNGDAYSPTGEPVKEVKEPKYHGTELRNPVGIGFRKNSNAKIIQGTPLPNLEHPRQRMRSWSDTPPPVSFGTLGMKRT